MSRIGKKPIAVPSGVKVTLGNGTIVVEGKAGRLERALPKGVTVNVSEKEIVVARTGNDRSARAMHGLTRSLLENMVTGVLKPFEKSLEITGVGYRAEMQGDALNLVVGFAHEVKHPIPKEVTCKVDKQTTVHLSSPNKELVGRVAAEIRAYKPCEPYQGKGIKYAGEKIRRKEGKTGAA